MALTDKDIVITPNRGQSADPKVEFKGASSTLGPQTISLNVYPTSNGTLSFEGSAGQLFSITNTLTGTIYSVNDVSGIPSIEVLDTGLVKLAQYSGNVLVGTATDTGYKLRVAGNINVATNSFIDFGPNATWSSTLRVGGNGHGGSGRASVVTTDGNLHLDGGGSGTGLYLNYYVNGPIYATSSAHVVIHAGNYGSYALPLSGGTMTGVITTVSGGTAINFSGQSDSFGYNATSGLGTYIKGTGSTYVYGGGSFFDGGAQRAILHAGNYSSYALPLSGGTMTGSISQNTYNIPLIKPAASGSTSAGAGFAIQQTTNEGWTGIFVDFEPYTEWGFYHDNPNNYFSITAGSDTNSLRSFTVPSVSSGNRTAYEKIRFQQGDGRIIHNAWTTYGRNYSNDWIEFPNYSGLYSPLNNAHFYPNNASYGSWRVAGSRNSWNGIEFDTNNGNVSLMIDVGGNTSGFHNNSYGWQMRWNNGTGYINKNAYGAGTEATILDSSNYTNYTNGVFLRAAGGNDAMNFNTTQYNTMYYAYIANSPNKPPGYNYSYGTIITFDPGVGVAGRAQFYVSHAGNDLIFRGGWNANDSWQTWNRVLTDQNYTSWAPSLTGSGASGTWGISITGSAASAASVPASGITGQTGMWTSTARPGPYRLYRRDNDSNYSVQTYWTGTRWRLYGYSGDDGHADTHVGYADSAGSSGSSGDANYLITGDNRIIAPSEDTAYRMRFGFTSWNNNNDPPWADYLHMRSYGDNSGGSDNLVMFLKNGFGIRIWQQVFGSGSAYSDYRDVLTSGNYNSYALPISGGTATGRVSISVNGRTTGYSGSNFEVFTSDNTPPGISFHRGGYSATLLYENDGELYTNPWTSRAQTGKLLAAGNYNSYAPTLTGGGASGTWGINITGNAGGVGGYVVSTSPSANTIPTRNNSGYLSPGSWIQFDGAYGLYWPNNNNAHIHANDLSSYAPVVIRGSRSGYHGIAMYDMPQGGGNGHWMSNGNASGYYNESYGWKFFHESGNFYIHSGTYGGGTSYTALHSGNYTSYSPTLLGAGASGTWNINITGTGTDPNKVPLTGGTMTGTLFINSKLRVNNASGPSDSTYGTAADIPMHMSGNTRTQTTFLIENTVNSSIDYPVIVIRRTLTPVGSRFGGMIRFADKNSSGTEISSQIYSFNRLTSQDLFLDAGSGTEDRVVLRAGSSSSMQVAENFIMNVKAAIYAVTTPAALDIDCKQSNYFTKTINGDSTFTFSNVPAPSGFTIAYSFTLELTHTSGTVTWPASVRWPGNVLPSLTTGKTHLFMFVTDDGGSRWRGSFLSNYDN